MLAKAADTRAALRERAMDAARNDAAQSAPAERSQSESADAAPQARRKPKRRPLKAPTYAPKPCMKCGALFQPTGPNCNACASCSPRRVRPPRTSGKSGGKPTPEPTPASERRG
jgi:hypothetical protein